MVGGNYELTLRTPLGIRRGTLELEEAGSSLTGRLDVQGRESLLEDGQTDGENFSFRTVIPMKTGDLTCSFSGCVRGWTLSAAASTPKATVALVGTRIERCA